MPTYSCREVSTSAQHEHADTDTEGIGPILQDNIFVPVAPILTTFLVNSFNFSSFFALTKNDNHKYNHNNNERQLEKWFDAKADGIILIQMVQSVFDDSD